MRGIFPRSFVGHLGQQAPQALDDLIRLEQAFAAAFSNINYDVQESWGELDLLGLFRQLR